MSGPRQTSLSAVRGLCKLVAEHGNQLEWLLLRQAALRKSYILFLVKDLGAVAMAAGETARELGLDSVQRQALVATVHSDVRAQFDFAANIVTPGIRDSSVSDELGRLHSRLAAEAKVIADVRKQLADAHAVIESIPETMAKFEFTMVCPGCRRDVSGFKAHHFKAAILDPDTTQMRCSKCK